MNNCTVFHRVEKWGHTNCHQAIRKSCPPRFGSNTDLQDKCHRYLWIERFTQPSGSEITTPAGDPLFREYLSCMETFREKIDICRNKLTDICEDSPIRSIKTVRATMAARSLYTRGDLVREAKLFCRNVAGDIVRRRKLEARYPGSIKEVLYDRFVEDPFRHTEDLYEFINAGLTDSVRRWLKRNTKDSRKSTTIAHKWRRELAPWKANRISDACRNVFQLIDYDWRS
ncbi:hypothetical protein LSH36_707g01123 [Paralvinella palmiformis]|uniref:Uncharacterized protein n=1 Tax=Paralvinella palmiformis TaxID=53620 RepID=A0AAD9MTB8_9ANNE|nr:hypothetical protein LSH36_707g01123 [Paralvinella palmiformis]